jgi:hypothetical protein
VARKRITETSAALPNSSANHDREWVVADPEIEERRDPQSRYCDWSKKKSKNARSGIVFPGAEKSTWTYDECSLCLIIATTES